MRKEIRRIIMFCTILTVGLLLLVVDVTFIQLLFLLVGIAIILPFLLGLVTLAEVSAAYQSFKDQHLKKISILKKLDEIKLFEKGSPKKQDVPSQKAPEKPKAPASAPKESGTKMPFGTQIQSFVSSIKSLGTLIQERTKRERKVSDINTMLDKAVSGKVEAPKIKTPETPGTGTTLPAPGGAGSGSAAETDPFLSLSSDEFDAGLLDGLDDEGMESPAAPATAGSATEPAMSVHPVFLEIPSQTV